jgi:hypothetical protein
MLMAVISAHFATCWDLSWTSWTSLCSADGALEFVTLKKMAQLAPQGFLATIGGGQGICLLNCSVFVKVI